MKPHEAAAAHNEQQTYWNQIVRTKVVECYVRRYRDEQAWWISRVGLFKAVVTSGTIGAWAIWKDYAFVWGILIGNVQVLDAAKDYIPQSKHVGSASQLALELGSVIIEARFEWYAISRDQCTADEVMERWRALAKGLREAEMRHFPNGLPEGASRKRLAEADARAYFVAEYGLGAWQDG